jgi:hypothetical protein
MEGGGALMGSLLTAKPFPDSHVMTNNFSQQLKHNRQTDQQQSNTHPFKKKSNRWK